MRTICLTACMIAWLHSSALAAPAGALNKTITISYATTGMVKSPNGQSRGFTTGVSVIVYVSSAGRLFVRSRSTNRGDSRNVDFAPGGNGSQGRIDFQGDKLVGVKSHEVGATQMTVTFDPRFSSCSVSVIEGHSNGIIRRIGPDGATHELSGVTTTSPSCSIRSGNAFAS